MRHLFIAAMGGSVEECPAGSLRPPTLSLSAKPIGNYLVTTNPRRKAGVPGHDRGSHAAFEMRRPGIAAGDRICRQDYLSVAAVAGIVVVAAREFHEYTRLVADRPRIMTGR